MKKRKMLAAVIVLTGLSFVLAACKSSSMTSTVSQEGIKDVEVKEYAVHEISDTLKDSIVCIKNLETVCSEGETTAIILDKKGSVYLKTVEDIVKLEGTTTLKEIAYAVESPYEYGDIIIYDNSGMYYISKENRTIRDYELSKDIGEIVKFNEESKIYGIDKSGNGVIGMKEETWSFKPSIYAKNVSFAGGSTLLMGEKLYSDSIMLTEEVFQQEAQIENVLLQDNVNQVWAWDNLKSDTLLIVSTNASELYLINPLQPDKKHKLDLNETVQNVYFVSGGAYAEAVVVGESNIYIVTSDYNAEMDLIYNLDQVEGMGSYIDSIKGFYCEENKLFALMEDGNIYMVKDFLEL